MTSPADLTATELVKNYAAGSLSPVEATAACLARIERLNSDLNAFCLLDVESAMAAARQSEERWRRKAPAGMIDGVPVSIKDFFLAKRWPTLRGSRAISPDQPWDQDAPAVARLREQGGVLLGKTTTPEFGHKAVGISPLTGITRNPWNPALTPGGSSSGAAVAAAAGMAPLNLGSDAAGSIRIPASFTGIVGHKPTGGLVPSHPASAFGHLAVLGPMTRSVADAALMLRVLSLPDWRDARPLPYREQDFTAEIERGVEGLKIGFAPTLNGATVDPEIAALVESAARRLEEQGATVEPFIFTLPGIDRLYQTVWEVMVATVVATFDADKQVVMDGTLRRMAARGAATPLLDHTRASWACSEAGFTMARLYQRYDVIVMPTMPIAAFPAELDHPHEVGTLDWFEWAPFCYPFNATFQPASSVPCGLTRDGRPAGLQIVGPVHADALVLRVAAACERGYVPPRPPLVNG